MIISTPQLLILGLLGVTLALFIWGKWRYDVVSFFSLLTAVILGLVKPEEAFAGFGHPGTITVALVLTLGFGLAKSGLTTLISNALSPISQWPPLQIAAIVGVGAILSAFMNNVGVLALLMPVAIQSAVRGNYSPSMILMPLSFGTLLGGLVTMIGTPPNIVMATYREDILGEPFGMFDFTPVGIIVATVGVLFLAFIGWRFLGKRPISKEGVEDLFDIKSYLTEVRIGENAKILGKTIEQVEDATKDLDFFIVGLARQNRKYNSPAKSEILRKDDILIIEASPKDTELFVMRNQLSVGQMDEEHSMFQPNQDDWVEAVVSTRSEIEGRVVEQLNLQRRYGVTLLAVSRQGRPYRGRLKAFRFRVGDVLLLRGDPDTLREFLTAMRIFPLVQRGLQLGHQQKPLLALSIFAVAIALATFKIPFTLTFGFAVLAMVLTGIIPVRQLYDGIEWPVVILIGSLIPVGQAFAQTGASQLVVNGFLGLTADASPYVILTILLILTMSLTDILNNVATIVIMAPIAKQVADSLQANPDPFLMTVTVGASCAFLTPIGHQNNALIMGPGKYKFSDYWRMGLPLEIIIVLVAVPTILKFWPLGP